MTSAEDWVLPPDEMKRLGKLTLEEKVSYTVALLQEWYDHFGGKVYVAFSGGKDSTVLLHLARSYVDPNIPGVFSDTGLEYPEIREFVKTKENITWIKPEKSPNRFQRMKVNHPAQWKYCMDKLGIREVMDYLGYPVE